MRQREYEFICSSCGSEFMIITEENSEPETCPFCGNDLEDTAFGDDNLEEEE